jgi:ABC-2 type transport system permease protein
MNLLEGGYATLDSLFFMAPWIFLMLIPAITMRMFSEERKTGTLDLLLTRPLSEMQIIMAKFFASLVLVLLSLLPTLIYFISIIMLGNPVGNIDYGGFWGSFTGLVFLAAGYGMIGLFCSSVTDNVIVSFISAAACSLFICFGFDRISAMVNLGTLGDFLMKLGIIEHYKSMSRGVIDSRDVVYFLALIALFAMLTRYNLEKRK